MDNNIASLDYLFGYALLIHAIFILLLYYTILIEAQFL